jgi:hypothetical protein
MLSCKPAAGPPVTLPSAIRVGENRALDSRLNVRRGVPAAKSSALCGDAAEDAANDGASGGGVDMTGRPARLRVKAPGQSA